jgi:hypothetical protein
VVVGSSGWQLTGLLEYAPELVQEAVQEGSTCLGEGCRTAGSVSAAAPTPSHVTR